MNPKRDVILTTVHRMRLADVASFLDSLQRTGYRGETVFFVSFMDAASEAGLRRRGVTVVPFRFWGEHIKQRLARPWPLWRWLFRSGAAPAAREWLAHAVFHLFYRRHLLYLQFLRTNAARYDRVFLTDARDVFFQADPFAWNPPPGVHFFLEEATNRIGTCQFHERWLTSQFGPEAFEQLKKEVVCCAGTVFGDIQGILKYLQAMVEWTMRARSLRETTGDQGIHNYLLYKETQPEYIVHDNRHSPLMTVGAMKTDDIRLNPQGWVIDDDGQMPAVLHQHDRHPAVEKALLAHLRDGAGSGGPRPEGA